MITLQANDSFRVKRRDMRIACLSGVIWVTREGDLCDFILRSGDSLESGNGLTVATALERAVINVARRSPWWVTWLGATLQRMRGGIRSHADSANSVGDQRKVPTRLTLLSGRARRAISDCASPDGV